MIAEKKLTKALISKVNKMGWELDQPTYQGVCRYAFDKWCYYFMIMPFGPKNWVVWLIVNFKKPNLQDGKLNEVNWVEGARTYEQALCKGVAEFVDMQFNAYLNILKAKDIHQKIERVKKNLRESGFDI